MKISLNNKLNFNVITLYDGDSCECELCKYLNENKLYEPKLGNVYIDLGPHSSNKILLGLGNKEELTEEKLRLAGFKLIKESNAKKIKSLSFELPDIEGMDVTKSIVEGMLQATYSFDKFLSDSKPFHIEEVSLSNADENSLKEAQTLIDGIFFARELVNEPAMYMYPETLANITKDKLGSVGVDVQILGVKEIQELDMKAFMAVAQGSDKDPRFIIMKYNGDPANHKKIAFVGKGLTYDSGGYCIKPPSGMATMHADMGGAGTVIGAMYSIAKAGLKANVVAVVAACENLISGKAYKTGDIIGSMAGKTIEVGNTDAEGRLTLADALFYVADREVPEAIIDFATLTGACVVALGEVYTGAVTNNDNLMNEVKDACVKSGEKVWLLPSCDEFRDLIKSEVADLSNIGKKGAGCITAGLFLEHFVKEIPWVHMDIAGTAYLSSPLGYLPKGATGIHVKTLFNLVKNR